MSDQELILFFAYIIGFFGAILLWFFGLPRLDIFSDGTEPLAVNLGKEKEAKNRNKRKRYDQLSHLGIGLIGLSFLLQIISLWVEL